MRACQNRALPKYPGAAKAQLQQTSWQLCNTTALKLLGLENSLGLALRMRSVHLFLLRHL